ncbi:MAG: hypothetical protein C0468_06785, partial [Planctomyces sp.]|nr:hypothetical protein [Planctomyces sp.]
MDPSDTIAALATGPRRAERALIRLSGPGADAALGALGLPTGHPARATVRGRAPERRPIAAVAQLRVLGAELPCPLCAYPAGGSYTAEPAAELMPVANPTLCRAVLAALLGSGARLAEPGEFTARAFMHGRLPADRVEAVAAMVAAATDEQLATARSMMRGHYGAFLAAQAESLADALALVEAGVDFTDQEDVVAISASALGARLGALVEGLARLAGLRAARAGAVAAPRVALTGPPSAGKSTLFNALLGRRRAVTDAAPGTTRDALEEPLTLAGSLGRSLGVLLCDTPGLDHPLHYPHPTLPPPLTGHPPHPPSPQPPHHQDAARAAVAAADILLVCVPPGAQPPPAATSQSGARTILVRTMADLVGRHAHTRQGDAGPGSGSSLGVCAIDGSGLPELRGALFEAAWSLSHPRAGDALIPRHAAAIESALGALQAARELVASQAPGSA